MIPHASRIDTGAGVSFIASAVIHLAVFLLLVTWGQLFPSQTVSQVTYYVDMVTLPTASPPSGNPEPKAAEAVALSPPPPAQAVRSLTKTTPKTVLKPAKTAAPQESAETESAFTERLERLENSREARREEAVLEKLRRKVTSASSTKSGIPGASGTEPGSRYADFVKSRLEDALKITSSYSTKSPEVAVRLTIAADGKLSRMKIERSSGDVTFELAVRRAIDLASEKFTAPPGRTVFENGFVFKPKGISSGTSR